MKHDRLKLKIPTAITKNNNLFKRVCYMKPCQAETFIYLYKAHKK